VCVSGLLVDGVDVVDVVDDVEEAEEDDDGDVGDDECLYQSLASTMDCSTLDSRDERVSCARCSWVCM
jgi:hypothetical protein